MLTFPLGPGQVLLAPDDGAPLQVVDPDAPGRRFLLDERTDELHTAEHRWGTGFLVSDAGSGRWRVPTELSVDDAGVSCRFEPVTGLALDVQRRFGDVWAETYRLTNRHEHPVTVGSFGLNTPVRDVYPGAAAALREAVHAHVWTGGEDAWLLAEPMSGTGRLLGLVVRTGALWAYSVESRNQAFSSNVRGHIVLHPTDHARNADAFGGQPPLTLAPGEAYELSWELRFHRDRDAFLSDTRPGLVCDRLTAEVGTPVRVTGDVDGLTADAGADVVVSAGEGRVTGARHGVVHVGTRRRRTAVLFTAALPDLVRTRVDYLLRHHRPTERPAPFDAAFVPYDTVTGLTQTANAWQDWSDGAERLAMPLLLQQALRRGWVSDAAEVAAALDAFNAYARVGLLDETAAPHWGSNVTARVRIYNSPWLAQFFLDEHQRTGREQDLELAARVVERSFELGAGKHLSIGHPEAVVGVAEALRAAPRTDAGSSDNASDRVDRADRLLAQLVAQAEHFRSIAEHLPGHEVNYEQSMVAPLVSLYAIVESLLTEEGRDGGFVEVLGVAIRWLRAFGGPQPHVRLHQVGIRHWDGYWFGQDRLWGDTFPHHWSVLTAVALRQLPEALRSVESDAAADQIFRANLASFQPDGSATCAFVLPSAVDGRPGYRADPLANDQDWALTLYLQHGGPGAE